MSRSWNNFKLEVADVIVLDKIKVVVSRIDNNILHIIMTWKTRQIMNRIH